MTYGDEDVETAARALWEAPPAFVTGPIVWADVSLDLKEIYRRDAHAVLDAVAPAIAARAVEAWLDTTPLPEAYRAVMSRVTVNEDLARVSTYEDHSSVRGPGWFVAECGCGWATSGREPVVEEAAQAHELAHAAGGS